MQNSTLTLSDLLLQFDEELTSVIDKITESYSRRLIKGYKLQLFHSGKNMIASGVSAGNKLVEDYCHLFKGKNPSKQTVEEVRSFIKCSANTEERVSELRRRYIHHYNIVEKFPDVKLSKILEIYDFPQRDEKLIVKLCDTPRADLLSMDYYNEKNTLFEFTDKHEAELLERCTVYATRHELVEILSLHLACIGLSNLKAPDYSFKELPEIDHRLLKKVQIAKYGDGISVDLNAFINNGSPNEHSAQLSQSINKPSHPIVTLFPKSKSL